LALCAGTNTIAVTMRKLDYGDKLQILREQITAFENTWHWGGQAQDEFRELMKCNNTDVSQMMVALRAFLGEYDMMAYLTMMANRLMEMHRVLKPSGSLYLHCDSKASHYLKIVLDGVFGKDNYLSEIIWKRTSAHSSAHRLSKRGCYYKMVGLILV
jgi:adenine specific DNA methylase Mod